MKKTAFLTFALIASFIAGFAFKTITAKLPSPQPKKVTGIGGVFFKCKDSAKLKEWYKKHLGFDTNKYGTLFKWREAEDSTKEGQTQWTPFSEKTKYFDPSTKDFMINYRVENLSGLVLELKKDGVTMVDTMETYSYGKFVHIMDEEGNKIELWQPL